MRHPNLLIPIGTILLFGTLVLIANLARSADKYERKGPYTGPELKSLSLMCKASHLAAGGFWRNLADLTVDEAARIEEEAKPTYWKVSISDNKGTAQVIRFNANREALEAPLAFSAEHTRGGGLLLVKTEREPGDSPETISIDPLNSSFVYSSQHVNLMWNRANIWYGSCKPSQ